MTEHNENEPYFTNITLFVTRSAKTWNNYTHFVFRKMPVLNIQDAVTT